MRKILPALIASAVAAAVASPAAAETTAPAPVFGGTAIGDAALAAIRGSADYSAGMTRRQARLSADLQSRFDTHAFVTVARIEMDVWWSSEGSQLIAESVRSSLR